MRIINNPNPIKEETHICEKCECEFAYNESDIHKDSYSNGICGPGCYGWEKHWVVCPNCGQSYYIYDSTKEPRKSYNEIIQNAELLDLLWNN